jgi:hypothetical protein
MTKAPVKEHLQKVVEVWNKIRRMVVSVEDGYRAIYRCFACEGEDIRAAGKGCKSDIKDLLKLIDDYRLLLYEFVPGGMLFRIEKLAKQLQFLIEESETCMQEMLMWGNRANELYYEFLAATEGEQEHKGEEA